MYGRAGSGSAGPGERGVGGDRGASRGRAARGDRSPVQRRRGAIAGDPRCRDASRCAVVGGNLSSRGPLPPLWPLEFNLAKDRRPRPAGAPARRGGSSLYPLDVVRRLRCDARAARRSPLRRAGALLAAGSRRWLARAALAASRGFPVWDLPPALEAAGALARRRSAAPDSVHAAQRRCAIRCTPRVRSDSAWAALVWRTSTRPSAWQ